MISHLYPPPRIFWIKNRQRIFRKKSRERIFGIEIGRRFLEICSQYLRMVKSDSEYLDYESYVILYESYEYGIGNPTSTHQDA